MVIAGRIEGNCGVVRMREFDVDLNTGRKTDMLHCYYNSVPEVIGVVDCKRYVLSFHLSVPSGKMSKALVDTVPLFLDEQVEQVTVF